MDFSCLFESQFSPSYLPTDRFGQACYKLNLPRVLVWCCCCFHMLLQTRWKETSFKLYVSVKIPAIPWWDPFPSLNRHAPAEHGWWTRSFSSDCSPLRNGHWAPQMLLQLDPSQHQGWKLRKPNKKVGWEWDQTWVQLQIPAQPHALWEQIRPQMDLNSWASGESLWNKMDWKTVRLEVKYHLFCSQRIWWGRQCERRTRSSRPVKSFCEN